ncbi:hypothetical protein GGE07_001174 [Sinorhizobium terangae]|nr:OB-fold domain-containing protein [Sinorhizobium terangae]MBB4184548.1 hypothetical protein [Sinorhizobium terangae]
MTSIEGASRVETGSRDEAVCLDASREKDTGKAVFPRIPGTSPSADRFYPISLSPEAILYSHTTIHPNPKTGLKPFVLVYADFPEGVRVFGRLELADGEKPEIGSWLRVCSRGEGADSNTAYFFTVAKGGKS